MAPTSREVLRAACPRCPSRAAYPEDGTDFAETWVIDNAAAGAQRIAAVGLYGDHLRVGYASMGGWKPFGQGATDHPRRGQRPQ